MYVEMKQVNKKFGSYEAAKNINFGIEKGKLVALLGPSGSGKTTILRMIAGLETQDSGDVIIEGTVVNDIPPGKRGIGFVFQNYALFRYMTVEENIAFGLRVQKKDKKEIAGRVKELISLVGLDGMAIPTSYPADSGSAWLLPGLLRQTPSFFCSMNRLRLLTQKCAKNSVSG